jgi:GTP pyrophosphokinase
MAVHLATCCHPLPGDRIVGIVTSGRGVTIHTIDCESLDSFANVPERWLDVSWDARSVTPELHLGRINVILTNEPGSLNAMTSVIAKNLGNISNLKITNRSQDVFEFLVDVEVRDVKHLSNIVAALRADPLMHTVTRVRG